MVAVVSVIVNARAYVAALRRAERARGPARRELLAWLKRFGRRSCVGRRAEREYLVAPSPGFLRALERAGV